MSPLIFGVILIILTAILSIYKCKYKKGAITRKKNLEKYFGLKELKKDIEYFNNKETILYFHCEKLVRKYFSSLIVFNKEYIINENDIIRIKVEKIDVLSSDFTEKIILGSEKGVSIDFIINISYNMNNHYQLILDKIENSLSVEVVLYSKENKFPKIVKRNNLIFKDFGEESIIPNLKRYNLINIPKDDFYKIYNTLSQTKLDENNEYLLKDKNSLFVNFIIKSKEIEGRIFDIKEKQEEDLSYKDFSKQELDLLKEVGKLKEKIIKSSVEEIMKLRFSIVNEYQILVLDKKNYIKNIINILINAYFFDKYFNKNVDKEVLDLLETAIFIRYIEGKGAPGIVKFSDYLEQKNAILSDKYEFKNFEKLMIIINIQKFIFEIGKFKFVKLYDLSEESPFIESEKLFFDIIKKLNTNSGLYFFYLQINSSSGIDYISYNTWYKIKYIPLIKIKAHLMYSRHPFFFIYEKYDNKGAFVNPQNLVIKLL